MWRAAILSAVLILGGVRFASAEESVPSQAAVSETAIDEITDPARRLAGECRTGTLLFSRGDCLAVRIYTGSGYTHVAAVIRDGDAIHVYDSMNGVGVRKLSLEEYLATQCPDEVLPFQPRRPFTAEETACFQGYLDSQLGRPYSVKHHLTGKKAKGMHCSEYVTEALMAVEWLKAENAVKVSPASLALGVESHGVHERGERIQLPFQAEPLPEPRGCCARWWQGTKTCTIGCCRQLSRWVLCR